MKRGMWLGLTFLYNDRSFGPSCRCNRSQKFDKIIWSYRPIMLLESYTTATNFLAVACDPFVFAYFKRIGIRFCLFLNAFSCVRFDDFFTSYNMFDWDHQFIQMSGSI